MSRMPRYDAATDTPAAVPVEPGLRLENAGTAQLNGAPVQMSEIHEQTDEQPFPRWSLRTRRRVKVSELIREEGNPNLKLRVFVSGGGCSGFQYGFTFDENEEEGDTCVENQGVRAAHRPDELPVPGRRRDRLQGRPRRRPVRDPQSERDDHLRLRIVVLGLTSRIGRRARHVPFPTSLPRWTSGPTAFTWSSPVLSHGQLIDRRPAARDGAARGRTRRAGTPEPRVDRARARSASSASGNGCATCSAESVRVVGTNTLRKAKRKGAFLDRAREALGHPIEIISGVEEARLIYLGVAHTTPSEGGHRLVIDIGGGSTELIVGEGLAAQRLESLYMGCVSLSDAHFADGDDHREAHEARAHRGAARARAGRGALPAFGMGLRVRVLGHDAGRQRRAAARWRAGRRNHPRGRRLAGRGVPACRQRRRGSSCRARRRPAGDPARRPRDPGRGRSSMLGIESMRVADGALREGLLYDLLGRLTDEDARVRSVRAMEGRFHVDVAQADRVEATALGLPAPGARRAGDSTTRSPSWRCAGPRGCTRSGSTSRTRTTTGTAPTCCSTPTCRAFRVRSSSCSRCSSARTGASSTSSRARS